MSIAVYTCKPVGIRSGRLAVAEEFAGGATNQPGLVCCRESCFAQFCGEVAHRAAKRIYLSLVYNEEAGGLVWGGQWSVVGITLHFSHIMSFSITLWAGCCARGEAR